MEQRRPALLIMVSGMVFLAVSACGFWFNGELSRAPISWTDGKITAWTRDADKRLAALAISGALAATGVGLVLIGAWHAAKPPVRPPPSPTS